MSQDTSWGCGIGGWGWGQRLQMQMLFHTGYEAQLKSLFHTGYDAQFKSQLFLGLFFYTGYEAQLKSPNKKWTFTHGFGGSWDIPVCGMVHVTTGCQRPKPLIFGSRSILRRMLACWSQNHTRGYGLKTIPLKNG